MLPCKAFEVCDLDVGVPELLCPDRLAELEYAPPLLGLACRLRCERAVAEVQHDLRAAPLPPGFPCAGQLVLSARARVQSRRAESRPEDGYDDVRVFNVHHPVDDALATAFGKA